MAAEIESGPPEPRGALPANVGQKIAAGAVGLLLAAVLLAAAANRCTGPPEPDVAPNTEVTEVQPDAQTAPQAAAEVKHAAEEARARAARAESELRARQAAQRAAAAAAEWAAGEVDEAVLDVQSELRIAEIRRRYAALQTPPVAFSARGAAPQATAEQTPAPPEPEDALSPVDRALIAALEQSTASDPEEPPPAEEPSPDPTAATLPTEPNDPDGWERIYEGSFLEAVLVTELRGDMAGPVAAMVAVDFYSRDRSQVLVPQGSRVLGTASAVSGAYQTLLAVAFHRLILPDGTWVRMPFLGLNQAGSTGLKDKVNRHYAQMFGATAAVGVIAGLALSSDTVGAGPYGGGGVRAGMGRATAESGFRIMDRFLNRLPTITIRAGHRVRIWLTSDVLVPLPRPNPLLQQTVQRGE